jgi:hypothetical protein
MNSFLQRLDKNVTGWASFLHFLRLSPLGNFIFLPNMGKEKFFTKWAWLGAGTQFLQNIFGLLGCVEVTAIFLHLDTGCLFLQNKWRRNSICRGSDKGCGRFAGPLSSLGIVALYYWDYLFWNCIFVLQKLHRRLSRISHWLSIKT